MTASAGGGAPARLRDGSKDECANAGAEKIRAPTALPLDSVLEYRGYLFFAPDLPGAGIEYTDGITLFHMKAGVNVV
jgi:hypothetical protein